MDFFAAIWRAGNAPPAAARRSAGSLARNMDWTWTGHAIVSPSFRVGFAGARRTFCQAPITPEDTADLIGIILATDTRSGMVAGQLNNGARFALSAW
jgi:hypothetical protein